jgi:hypothetical protein
MTITSQPVSGQEAVLDIWIPCSQLTRHSLITGNRKSSFSGSYRLGMMPAKNTYYGWRQIFSGRLRFTKEIIPIELWFPCFLVLLGLEKSVRIVKASQALSPLLMKSCPETGPSKFFMNLHGRYCLSFHWQTQNHWEYPGNHCKLCHKATQF